MILFNVKEAREQLMEVGEVCTLRSKKRTTGKNAAYTGDSMTRRFLCTVDVERIGTIRQVDELEDYLPLSGFNNTKTWIMSANPGARTLYKVVKVD